MRRPVNGGAAFRPAREVKQPERGEGTAGRNDREGKNRGVSRLLVHCDFSSE
ncbi:MAG: hypothetical protein ACM3NS_02795 [Deltaproteobacteria bacterium]